MKHIIHFLAYISLFSLPIILFMACDKEPSFVPSLKDPNIYNSNRLEISKFKSQEYLSIIGKYILASSSETELRKAIYSGIGNSIDGDDNVLFEDLLQKLVDNNYDFNKRLNSLYSNKRELFQTPFYDALSQFRENKGNLPFTPYPQVYIPFYKELKLKGLIGKKPPIIFVHSSINKEDKNLSFTINDKNEIVEIPVVNEEFAKENEVWVISINESVLSEDSYKKAISKRKNRKSSRLYGGNNNSVVTNCNDSDVNLIAPDVTQGVRLNISGIQAFTHNEPWYSGASEIAIIAVSFWGNKKTQTRPFTTYNQSGPDSPETPWVGGTSYAHNDYNVGSGYAFQISRGDINTYVGNVNFEVTRDTRLLTRWGQFGDPRLDCIAYCIFEFDAGASITTATVNTKSVIDPDTSPNTNSHTFSFSSNDNAYVNGYVYWYTNPSCYFYHISNDMRADFQILNY